MSRLLAACETAGRDSRRSWVTLGLALSALVLTAPMLRALGAQQRPAGRRPPKPGAPATVGPAALALAHVTVVDVTDGRLLPDQTVLVVGHRIQAVGASGSVSLPRDTRMVDARGQYLIPGLWDMHVHTYLDANILYPYLLTRGVTGVREMNSAFLDSLLKSRREIAAGTRIGPRAAVTGGQFSTASEFTMAEGVAANVPGMRAEDLALVATTPALARHVVDSLKAAGVDFIKVHSVDLPRAVFFAAAAEARRVGIPIVGHLLDSIAPAEASDSGQRSLEHVTLDACRPGIRNESMFAPSDSEAAAACAAMAARFRRNGTWVQPGGGAEPTPLCPDSSHHVGRYAPADEDQPPGSQRCLPHPTVPAAPWAVLPLVAGTDVSFVIWPGAKQMPAFQDVVLDRYSVQSILAGFVAAGLSPLAALQTATLNPAKLLDATDSLGTVAPGKLADLVLLRGNPLEDIWNTAEIGAVVANGRYFDRAALDQILADLARGAVERTAAAKASADSTEP